MKEIEKNKLVSMLLSEDVDIRKLAVNYIKTNYKINFRVKYKSYFSYELSKYVMAKIWPYEDEGKGFNMLVIDILTTFLINFPRYFYESALSSLIDIIIKYNEKDR